MKSKSIIFLILIITGLAIFSCSKDEQNIEMNQEQQSTEIRNGKQGYIEHSPEESAFIHSIKIRVNAQNDFDFGVDYLNIKGAPDWDLAIISNKNLGDYKSIIVPIIKGDKINAFFYVFDGEELTYNYVDKSLIRPPYFVYVGSVNHVYEQIIHFYEHVLSDTPTEDGTGYEDGAFDDPEFGGCYTLTQVEVQCSCADHGVGETCNCGGPGSNTPYMAYQMIPTDCDDGGGGPSTNNNPGPTVGTGSNGNNNNNNSTNSKVIIANMAANSVCPILPQSVCDRLRYIIDNASNSDYCLYISTQVANLLENPTMANKAAVTCFIMNTQVNQYPSQPNTCSGPFNSEPLADFAEMYNEMNSSLLSWASSYIGLDNVACDLTVAGYTSEEKNQILQAYKDYLGDAPPPTGSDDINSINPELDNVNELNVVISNLNKPELVSMIPFFLDNPQHIPFIEEYLTHIDQFAIEYNLIDELPNLYSITNFECLGSNNFTTCVANDYIKFINQNYFFDSPTLQDFQGDQDGAYLAKLQNAVNLIKAAGVDWYADFIQELIDCEEFETIGDLHDTWYMVKDFISEYNQFQICQREQEVTEWIMAIYSPDNVGIILGYVNFAPHMSVGYRAAFSVRFAQTATNLCSNLDKGFDSFSAFKQAYGNAGSGKAWHHIVEQNQIQNSGLLKKMIHHPDNLVKIESGAGSWHSRISAAYQQHGRFPEIPANVSLRNWLKNKPFETHYEWGIKVMTETK